MPVLFKGWESKPGRRAGGAAGGKPGTPRDLGLDGGFAPIPPLAVMRRSRVPARIVSLINICGKLP